VHGRSGGSLCCPVRATVRRILYHCQNKCKSSIPLASYYRNGRRVPIKVKDVTDTLRLVMTMNNHRTGIAANEVSARSIQAGGAVDLLHGQVDMDHIRMMGRWHSHAMMRFLYMQARCVVGCYAVAVFNRGSYTFLPDETFPIIDLDEE
jgi:hypothetical protein